MIVRAGTSGFSYDEWKGLFYPDDLPASERLRFYASELPTVEINNTFYRMPKSDVVASWFEDTPPDFRFVLKASRRITHFSKLKDVADSVEYLFKVSAILRDKLAATLFQLPPWLRKDVALLRDFLDTLPAGSRAALDFRHLSWFDDEVYALLRSKDVALCGGDPEDDGVASPLVATASFGYLRLRDRDYDDAALDVWAERVRAQPWQEAYVFFKHETVGPELAARFGTRFGGKPFAARPGIAKAHAAAPGAEAAVAAPDAAAKRKRPRKARPA